MHGCQYVGIALATHDRANDPHPCGAGDVGDDMVQLKVHEGQRLLHVLDMRRRVLHVPLSKAQIRTKRGDVAARSEARAQ